MPLMAKYDSIIELFYFKENLNEFTTTTDTEKSARFYTR